MLRERFFILNIIYIDVLLIVNVIIDYFLIKATEFFVGKNSSKLRVFFGSVFGALSSLLILLPDLSYLSIAINVAVAAVITFIVFGFNDFRTFIKNTVYYFLVSFLFAGLIVFINFSFSPENLATNNLSFYFDISPIFLLLSVLGFYLLLSVIEILFKKPSEKPQLVEVELSILKNVKKMNAFVDTGNKLCDPCFGNPVMLVKKELAETFLPKQVAEDILSQTLAVVEQQSDLKIRMIPYKALGHSGMLVGVVADYCKVLEKKKNKVYKPIVAFSDIPESDFNNSAVIGAEFLT